MIEYVSSWFTPTVLFCFLNLVIGTILISSTFKPQKKQHQLGDDNSVPQLARVPSLLERVRSFNYSLRQDHQVFDPFSHAQTAPSLLERFSALNFSFSRSEHPGDFTATTHHVDPPENETQSNRPSLSRAPSLLERVRSINLSFSRSRQPDPFPATAHYTESPEAQTHKVEVEEAVEGDSATVITPARRSKSATCAEIPAKNEKKKLEKSVSEKMEAEETVEQMDRRRPATVRDKKSKWGGTGTSEEGDEAVDMKADDFINRFKQQLKLQRLDSLLRYKETLHRRLAN